MIIRSVCMLIVISLVCVFGGDSNSDSIHDANFSTLQLQLMLDKISNCSEEIGLRTRQLQQCFLIKQNGSSSDQLTQSRTKPSQSEVWGLGLLFVTAISLCSLLGVSVLPLTQKAFYKQLLTALIGLAVGSLTSSSLFHLIPQALNLMEEDVGHSYLRISLMMWAGIWLFFMIERIMKVINDERLVLTLVATDLYWSLGQGRGVWCLSGFVVLRSTVKSSKVMHVLPPSLDPERRSQKLSGGTSLHSPESFITNDPNPIYESQEQAIKASFGHQQKPKPCHSSDHVLRFQKGTDSVIATVAWMVIFGDGLHNFIDGLSIGAAFNESILTGISISLAVMCEEFPHELGDFAVLLNAGMTMRQALLYNFMSACTCYLGLFVGIILGEIQASVYIFGFAAGMFLYIALVDMVPEMNEVAEEASKVSISSALFTLLLQNVGMGTGVIVLYLLAR